MSMFSFFKKDINTIEERYRSMPTFVVMGGPRNGTSLMSELVHTCGVPFIGEESLRKGDIHNPQGYFEYKRLNQLTRAFFREARMDRSPLGSNLGTLRAKGFIGRTRRFFTRREMKQIIEDTLAKHGEAALKVFPHQFYPWDPYLQNAKVIAVYREPHSSAYSQLQKWQASQKFQHALDHWTSSMRDLLYFTSVKESILIKYEDLFEEESKARVLTKIVEFVGKGELSELDKVINPQFNRSSKAVERLKVTYPLGPRTEEVFKVLEAQKI